MSGEPDAGKPHVRFDEGVQETYDIVTRLRPTLLAVLPVGRVRAPSPQGLRPGLPSYAPDGAGNRSALQTIYSTNLWDRTLERGRVALRH